MRILKTYWWDNEIEEEIIQKRNKYYKFLATKSNYDKVPYKIPKQK